MLKLDMCGLRCGGREREEEEWEAMDQVLRLLSEHHQVYGSVL